ncbi:MAG: tRNA uridine(34) 5-carboxymethylaminomethyl modification radical SAM/GNAT enzyme Elp3 [Cenarchaeum sp. SB0662_bin_33]|nr:tRNA uridine(34) 5-carboxymethylaminomethyl modification radical SAM/GNAT enzyme Elp3 [Cenarchaeum sp. SB0662_bin_33]
MRSQMDDACSTIANMLLCMENPTTQDAKNIIRNVCAEMSLERIPRKQEILAAAGDDGYSKLHTLLLKKPAKTGSGVAVIALMPKPYACPHGRCTYCPGGISHNTPNSYTGTEPSTINAIENQYNPVLQITTKLDKLISYGHDPSKLELVIVGGTFMFMPEEYRYNFIKSCYDALNRTVSPTLESAKKLNTTSDIRNVGFTIETKPDYCKAKHIDAMLTYGITRVEIGVQSLRERVYKIVNRGHTFDDVVESFQAARDAGLKIVAHMMPGLPTASPQNDIDDFAQLFDDERLRPDMLKIYPSLVLNDTPLYKQYMDGSYTPYDNSEMINVLATAKARFPEWVRVMRIQREIPSTDIIAGPTQGNLRQLVFNEMKRRNTTCRCIRCRQPVRISSKLHQRRIDYAAAGGHEVFLSYIDDDDQIYGFIRMRRPSSRSHRPEIVNSTLVRELHVYGRLLGLGKHGGIQHSGLGRRLLAEAERISKVELGVERILVISAVGTRQYYSSLGYSLYGPYMSKCLVG